MVAFYSVADVSPNDEISVKLRPLHHAFQLGVNAIYDITSSRKVHTVIISEVKYLLVNSRYHLPVLQTTHSNNDPAT